MRKIAVLALTLVVALALVGVAYASWTKTLYMDVTANTGTVNAKWVSAVSTDPPGANDLSDTIGGRYDKDVGTLECTIDTVDPQILHFTIINGYPSYYGDCECAWLNTGSIPVRVQDLRAGPEGGLVSVPFDVWNDLDLTGDGKADINFMLENGLGTQVHPGEKDTYSLWVHVKQAAPQGEELKFEAELDLIQYNKYVAP